MTPTASPKEYTIYQHECGAPIWRCLSQPRALYSAYPLEGGRVLTQCLECGGLLSTATLRLAPLITCVVQDLSPGVYEALQHARATLTYDHLLEAWGVLVEGALVAQEEEIWVARRIFQVKTGRLILERYDRHRRRATLALTESHLLQVPIPPPATLPRWFWGQAEERLLSV